jgi:ParB-like chromosome segregation protein Spo0J
VTAAQASELPAREGRLGELAQLPARHVAVDELHESSENPRRIVPARFAQLMRSLDADPQMLDARPIIALPDGTIVAGNMRHRAAVELGWSSVPCITVDLDRERARVWMLRDNQSYGDWELPSLSELLVELQQDDVDLDLLGFDERELKRLLDTLEADASPQLAQMTYSILIDCESESAQVELATRLEAEGLTVKLLMA